MKNLLQSLYVSKILSPQQTHDSCGNPKGLLRLAAQTIEPSGSGHIGDGTGSTIDHETESLIQFATLTGCMMDPDKVDVLFKQKQIKGGSEHLVALLPGEERVLKDLNVRLKATESTFDYLTDLALSNYFFDDDIRLEGLYVEDGVLHIVTSQPFISGIHPDWDLLKSGMLERGFKHENPNSRIPTFCAWVAGLGEVSIIDLHENNVVLGKVSQAVEPIDAHFYFDSVFERIAALRHLRLLD
ncbi:MAG: hypothetical protein JWL81_1847 [Verrucomicrobiales bacterium]|nr:hypothetical protein [Verrucomicrobiales bacterium]